MPTDKKIKKYWLLSQRIISPEKSEDLLCHEEGDESFVYLGNWGENELITKKEDVKMRKDITGRDWLYALTRFRWEKSGIGSWMEEWDLVIVVNDSKQVYWIGEIIPTGYWIEDNDIWEIRDKIEIDKVISSKDKENYPDSVIFYRRIRWITKNKWKYIELLSEERIKSFQKALMELNDEEYCSIEKILRAKITVHKEIEETGLDDIKIMCIRNYKWIQKQIEVVFHGNQQIQVPHLFKEWIYWIDGITAVVWKNWTGKSSIIEVLFLLFWGLGIGDNEIDVDFILRNKTKITFKGKRISVKIPKWDSCYLSEDELNMYMSDFICFNIRNHFTDTPDSKRDNCRLIPDLFDEDGRNMNYAYVWNEYNNAYWKERYVRELAAMILMLFSRGNGIQKLWKKITTDVSLNFEPNQIDWKMKTRIERGNSRFRSGFEKALKALGLNYKNFRKKLWVEWETVQITEFIKKIEDLLQSSTDKDKNVVKFIRDFNLSNLYNLDIRSKNWVSIKNASTGEQHFIELITKTIMSLSAAYERNKKHIYIVYDEPDLSLHPEWSRRLVNLLYKTIVEFQKQSERAKLAKITIILTTHSPILLSDIPKECILALDKNDSWDVFAVKIEEETFLNTLYSLFANTFFVDSFLWEFSLSKFHEYKKHKPSEEREAFNCMIGDPFIKNQFWDGKN